MILAEELVYIVRKVRRCKIAQYQLECISRLINGGLVEWFGLLEKELQCRRKCRGPASLRRRVRGSRGPTDIKQDRCMELAQLFSASYSFVTNQPTFMNRLFISFLAVITFSCLDLKFLNSCL